MTPSGPRARVVKAAGRRGKVGRPTLLSPSVERALLESIAAGVPMSVSCDRLEVDAGTVEEWVRRGEGRDVRPRTPLYAGFAGRVKKARAEDVARRVARIHQAAQGGAVVYRRTVTRGEGAVATTTTEERFSEPQWTADAWHLERTDPEKWGRVYRQQAAEDGGASVAEALAEAVKAALSGLAPGDRIELAARVVRGERLGDLAKLAPPISGRGNGRGNGRGAR